MNLCVNAAFPDRKGNAVDGKHVSRNAHVDVVAVSVGSHSVKTVHHDFFEPLIHRLQIPEITLPVLYPFKVGNRYAAGVRQNVGNDEDFLVKQDLIRLSSSRTIRAFANDRAPEYGPHSRE